MDELLGVTDAARLLKVHQNTVRNMAREGRLPTASLPGDRRLKFRRSDIERVIADRGSGASSVVARARSVEPELITANDLRAWGGRIAQDTAPEMLRRLLATTPGVTGVTIRAGDGVALGGWDGQAVSNGSGAPFLPAGRLGFEIGTDASVRKKADSDFENRKALPEADRRGTHFVFVTTRRWRDKDKWAAEKAESALFAGVSVLDADDLEGWLQSNEAVHIWLSEILGRFPRDVQTLDRWWTQFRSSTVPELPEALFSIGRDELGEALKDALRSTGGDVLTVRGVWTEEVLATIHATLKHLDPVMTAVLVRSPTAWSRLVESNSPHILIPAFDGPVLSSALDHGHLVVLIATGDTQLRAGSRSIALPPPGRSEAARVLRESGIASTRADSLAALYRRSPKAFVRALSLDPRTKAVVPDALQNEVPMLARLSLAVQWSDDAGDRGLIERLTGGEWSRIESLLRALERSDDPVFVRAGGSWRVAAPVETSLVLFGKLTTSDMEHWSELVEEVLLAPDPFEALESGERLMAQLRGETRPHSAEISEGLAQGVALISMTEDEIAGLPGSDWAKGVVRRLLDRASGDPEGALWKRLAPALATLAEAAPGIVLDSILDDLSTPQPVLRHLFPVAGYRPSDPFTPTSPHVYLLWTLEQLARSSDHFDGAVAALAKLTKYDDADSRSGNRAFESLQNLLFPWLQYTDAGSPAKLAFLEKLLRQEPELAWHLLLKLLPRRQFMSISPSAPRYRDWGPENAAVSPAEWGALVSRIVELVVGAAGADLERWTEVVPSLDDLHPRDFDRAVTAMADAAVDATADTPGARELWDALNAEILRHTEHAGQHWALGPERLGALKALREQLPEPGRASEYAQLFGWWPHIEGFDRASDTFLPEWRRLQKVAVTEVLGVGIGELERLVDQVENPDAIGVLLAEDYSSTTYDSLMLNWLGGSEARVAASRGYFSRRLATDAGTQWAREALRQLDPDDARRSALALLLSPGVASEVLESLDPTLATSYWLQINPWRVGRDHAQIAVEALLAVRRPTSALTVIEMTMLIEEREHLQPPLFRADDVRSVLEGFLAGELSESLGGDAPGRIASALAFLARAGVSYQELARYEFFFYVLIEHSEHRPDALFKVLRESPTEFANLVEMVTRPRDDSKERPDNPGASALAWRILHDWRQLPGTDGGGWEPDPEALGAWVREARSLLAEKDRAQVGDEMIGTLLSTGAVDAPGGWPSVHVRDLLEDVGSAEMESGLYIGIKNARDGWTKSVYEGGAQERDLAKRFSDRAEECRGWRRMNRVLRAVAESYERDARREDDRAKWDADRA